MKKQGAEVIDVAIPDYDGIMSGTSLIDAEFKLDINDVSVARAERAGAHARRGHRRRAASCRGRSLVTRRNAVADRRRPTRIDACTTKRETVRRIVTAAFDEHRLDAMAYPAMRRKPALIGEAQTGSNCSLSAVSGLPALSVPAGVTNDGLPIGLELLGRAFDEARLLALAYSYEQASHPRQPPFSAPPLVNGRAPGRGLRRELPVTGEGMRRDPSHDVSASIRRPES